MLEFFVVLGMHKSGTTLVSELLHHSGIEMVVNSNSAGYDQGDHYERETTNSLNKELLGCGNLSSLKVFTKLETSDINAELDTKARELVVTLFDGHKPRGFKDPRTCLTYRYWAKILPRHKLICVYRAYPEVHRHYTKRTRLAPFRGIRTLRAWHIYNSEVLEAYVKTAPLDRLIIDYSKLMRESSEMKRLEIFVGRDLADRRDKRLWRNTEPSQWRLRIDAKILKYFYRRDIFKLNASINKIIELESLNLVRS